MMYRCPGVNKGPQGHTYDWAPAANQAEVDALTKDGWFASLGEAIEAVDLASPPDTIAEALASATPEERAAAAQKALSKAAEDSLIAKRAAETDQATLDEATKALALATDKQESMAMNKELAESQYRTASADKNVALEKCQAASKAAASSKLRAQAADRTLADAASKILTADSLLAAAKQKALDQAEAAEKALAAAEAKVTKKGKA